MRKREAEWEKCDMGDSEYVGTGIVKKPRQ